MPITGGMDKPPIQQQFPTLRLYAEFRKVIIEEASLPEIKSFLSEELIANNKRA